MTAQNISTLQKKSCQPCEGGVDACTLEESQNQLQELNGWRLSEDGKRICKRWTVADFMAGIAMIRDVADLAESQGHHPDICLKNYKEVVIELTTHAIGGLSENDFIMAAKIDQLS